MLYKASPFNLNFKFFSCVIEIISYNPAVLMTAVGSYVWILGWQSARYAAPMRREAASSLTNNDKQSVWALTGQRNTST